MLIGHWYVPPLKKPKENVMNKLLRVSVGLATMLALLLSASKGHRVCFSTGFRLAGETGQSRSNLRERPAPNRGALQRSDGRCCEGRHQSRGRGTKDQTNPNLMTRQVVRLIN